MRVRTLSKNMLLVVKAALLLVSCVALLSLVRPANAQTAYTGNAGGRYKNGLIWWGYRLASSSGYAAITPDTNPDATYGAYQGNWSGFHGNFTMGAGWTGNQNTSYYQSTVKANNISNVGYRIGSFTDTQSACVSVYGFTNGNANNPSVEFYIVERYTTKYAIPGGTPVPGGTNVPIGGASYNIYKRYNGSQLQYWSVRTSQAPLNTNITVPVNAHFAKWDSLGLKTSGDRNSLGLSTESLYQGSGTATGSDSASVWGW